MPTDPFALGVRARVAVPARPTRSLISSGLSALRYLTLALFWTVFVTEAPTVNGQSTSTPTTRWAIALHGGAGGTPNEWSDERRSARLAGLKEALDTGRDILSRGGNALDAVEKTVRMMEDNPIFNAGKGAVLTSDRRAELDASVMEGASLRCGAVASVTRVANPIALARRVMTDTRHVLLIGPGADRFAESQGFPTVDASYFTERPEDADQSLYLTHDGSYLGTVGCVALDQHGNLAAGTSTGGTGGKMPGRVGDSPIIGAGTYANNATCALSATGVGEEFIRHAVAHDVSAQMQYAGRSLREAVDHVLTKTLAADTGGVIALDAEGNLVLQHNTPGMSCGAADSSGRFEVSLQVAAKR